MSAATKTASPYRHMVANYPGACRGCGEAFPAGTQIAWARGEGSYHLACEPKAPEPTAEELAEAARLQAEQEAETKRVKAENRARAKSEKEAEQARLLAEPIVQYGKGYDNRNSVTCSRCGGTGQMPFAVYEGKCFRCHGDGREFYPVLKQPRVKVTCEDIEKLQAGDICKHGGTLYRVTGFSWARYKDQFAAPMWPNQRVHLERLADGDTNLTLLREVRQVPAEPVSWHIERDAQGNEVRTPSAQHVVVSREMHHQPATQDEQGRWVTF